MDREFSVQVEFILDDLTEEVHTTAERSKVEVARDTAKELRQTSPRQANSPRSGRYARGWRYVNEGDNAYVYNQTDWQLTHLLADGHEKYNRFGGPYGDKTKANPHIDNAEAFAKRELSIRISRGLK